MASRYAPKFQVPAAFPDLLKAFERVLADVQFAFQHRSEVDAALHASRAGKGHFADYLIAALALGAGCRTT